MFRYDPAPFGRYDPAPLGRLTSELLGEFSSHSDKLPIFLHHRSLFIGRMKATTAQSQLRRLFQIGVGLLIFVATVTPPAQTAAPSPAANKSSELLRQVADEVWQHQLEAPEARLEQSLPIDSLPRWSYGKAQADAAFAQKTLKELDAVDPQKLSHEETLTLSILRWDAGNTIQDGKFFWLRSPVTPFTFYLTTVHRIFKTFAFEKPADPERYLDLLAEYPRVIEECLAHLRRQEARGIVLPKVEVETIINFLEGFVHEPGDSLFNVADHRLKAIDPPAAARLKQQVTDEIRARVNPALERLILYVKGPFLERAPEAVGLSQYPGGTDYYRHLVRFHTTMEVTPEEVHERGLREVDRLEREMADVRDKLGFKGTKEEFHKSLKTNPRFFAKTPDQIREKLLGFANSINPKLDKFFLSRPKASFDVKRLDPMMEGFITFGYYEPPRPTAPTGIYYFNGSKLEERSLLPAEGLIYHELVPGHHFHIASQKENDQLHPFRKNVYPTAFTEGWAVYSTILARELGQYQDLYDLYGHLSTEAMLTTRLVVDTGMNHLQWPRQRAMEYMREHTLASDTEIATETLRYSVDIPAQALAYEMGKFKILELRERAKQALGDNFDIRRFHQAVLGSGALPLTVLDQHINWFIEQEKKR
jgi:uncharacterized protein (DUF885 family)